ncbi:unnamed protein product [Kuraishia capsulata CBS 1993]|uniref:CRAL-TRIO domain-containing protein n=1 Tax=Kuraishia capsulata CBS 1993 TaxID=1382522 RepID=W6MJF2_9ASCO|nr:uncharacterized protein KUCA_T00000523001 [Kuraishia capsulata CBS 1993]CDK24557.1 unnamed protein product [Kuraishia capsulata CBS 1993]
MPMSTTVKVPFSEPSEYSETPVFEDPTSEDEIAKYDTVLKHFQDPELKLAIREKKCPPEEFEVLIPEEKSWITKECILRYIRATNWNVVECIKRLENSLVWRREFGIAGGKFQKLFPEDIAAENETGKQLVFGYDKGSRPCLILANGKQNTKASYKQIQNLIFYLERAIDFMPQGQDKLALCVDFKSYPEVAMKGFNMPSVTVGKEVLHVLQYHYPERLGRALFINIPWYAWPFLKICYPFVDPYTKQKVAFDKPFSDYIPLQQLAKNYGGEVDFEYDYEAYWPAFIETAAGKRKSYMKRFEELGATVGLSEYDLRA